jgi:hypothetical protein
VIERRIHRDVHAARFQRHDHLDLVVHVLGLGRIRKTVADRQIVRVLLEEERRLPIRIMPHLDGMGGVVAADAIDAANGELRVRPFDRKGDDRGRIDRVVRHEDGSP